MDRAIFFARARARLFDGALTQAQVEGMSLILDECAARGVADKRATAYVLATAFHETGRSMKPVREVGRGRGRAYGLPDPASGLVYYGRGFVQITWKANYQRLGARLGVDLVADPERALDPKIAAAILVVGMAEGLFAGRRLADVFGPRTDWIGARRIVNGLDRAADIARHARAFHKALTLAARGAGPGRPAALSPSRSAFSKPEGVAMKGYRTLLFNAAVALVGFAQSLDWVSILGSERAGWALTGIAVANMLLRAATDGPVGGASPQA